MSHLISEGHRIRTNHRGWKESAIWSHHVSVKIAAVDSSGAYEIPKAEIETINQWIRICMPEVCFIG